MSESLGQVYWKHFWTLNMLTTGVDSAYHTDSVKPLNDVRVFTLSTNA